jgi:hypothetical protein
MELGERPRPIRSVQYGSIEIGIDLYEHVAMPNGPDVLRIARPKAPRVARTGPVERNGYDLALGELVECNAPVSPKKVKCTTAWPFTVVV